ncbi:hypothetical protein FNF27_07608 [Cafeteria roenbergensis]|nr:hypothetical protein FNF31_04597 [Cafeteria roenbergensis]KAA0162579.1 hypothetical protein FNF28_04672 [Cafeteria roenbergensis]KAA0165600.1 hypothetical protein FNF27_07608 [Cafeteria roenbergensis]
MLDTARDVTVINGTTCAGEGAAESALDLLLSSVRAALPEEPAPESVAVGVLKSACRTATGADSLFLCRALFGAESIVAPTRNRGAWRCRSRDLPAELGTGAVMVDFDEAGTVTIQCATVFDVFAPEQVGLYRERSDTEATGDTEGGDDKDSDGGSQPDDWRASPWLRVGVLVKEVGALASGERSRTVSAWRAVGEAAAV